MFIKTQHIVSSAIREGNLQNPISSIIAADQIDFLMEMPGDFAARHLIRDMDWDDPVNENVLAKLRRQKCVLLLNSDACAVYQMPIQEFANRLNLLDFIDIQILNNYSLREGKPAWARALLRTSEIDLVIDEGRIEDNIRPNSHHMFDSEFLSTRISIIYINLRLSDGERMDLWVRESIDEMAIKLGGSH